MKEEHTRTSFSQNAKEASSTIPSELYLNFTSAFLLSFTGISDYYLQYHRHSLFEDQVVRTPLDLDGEEDWNTKTYMQMVKAWPSRVFRGYAYQQRTPIASSPPVRVCSEMALQHSKQLPTDSAVAVTQEPSPAASKFSAAAFVPLF